MLFHKYLKAAVAAAVIAAAGVAPAESAAQKYNSIDDALSDSTFTEVYRGTHQYVAPTVTEVVRDSVFDPTRVVTNKFSKNWFVFATGGAHSFIGDYSGCGKLSGTISPDWSVGIGKWFTPGVGLKVEFIKSDSKGYTEYLTGHYGYGDILFRADGTPYRKMKTRWWDISLDVILNLTRLYHGYEGYGSKKAMNQFMLNLGIGGVHHLGFETAMVATTSSASTPSCSTAASSRQPSASASTSRSAVFSIRPTSTLSTARPTTPHRNSTPTLAYM